ncbi:TadG family pilus assembly protein [Paraburkholderia caribensis]|uniref:TadG family pilus assembly protein n=1 Tax=Paraburkholderia caribensis TaxID=75105 RepID=UPI00286A07A6|nr:TadG family pilus assembly protein [Paraburkholderia caribensis]
MPLRQTERPSSMQTFAHRSRHASARRQRGATAVLAAVWIGTAVAALGVLDVGAVFLVRRQLQQAADMAAVAGAQTIGMAGGCAGATLSAQQAAARNGYAGDAPVSVACGRWTTASGPAQFDTSGATPLNAVQVTATQSVKHFFIGPARDVQAVATAKATDTASFSLSTNLASLSGGAINGLMSALLGANVSLDVATWQALASTNVRLGDLAAQIGVASIDELLNAKASVPDLAGAMVSVLSRNHAASASVTSALTAIQAAASGGAKIALGDGGTAAPGLLAIGLADRQAAASAAISALDALIVAAELAHGTSALDLGAALNPSAMAGMTLPVRLTAKAAILQAPVIAVGEAGMDGSGAWRTSAHAAQVRVYLDLYLTIPLLATIDLPLYVEGANGTAALTQTQCAASKAASTSTIRVMQTGVASACIGGDAASKLTNTTNVAQCQQPAKVASLVGSLVEVYAGTGTPSSGLNVALQSQAPETLMFNGAAGDGDDTQGGNANALGSESGGLLGQLISQLPTRVYLTLAGVPLTAGQALAYQPSVQSLADTLQPILGSLDTVLVPLLQLLGVQVGVSTVHATSLSCSDAQLVD